MSNSAEIVMSQVCLPKITLYAFMVEMVSLKDHLPGITQGNQVLKF